MPDTFPIETEIRLDEIGEVDIVVGIPSFNNAKTIGHVVRAVSAGLSKYFPEARTLIVNSDGGSTDDTSQIVLDARPEKQEVLLTTHPSYDVLRLVTPYHGLPGKGSALRTVFAIAERLGAKACAVVDSDLRSISPEWMDLLISPVFRGGVDFVAPLYHRHKYDGTITNSIVYPLTRALYGRRVRQPIGGDFGFSGKLATHYLKKEVWDSDVARFGIDIWMTTTAITDGFSVVQSFLGAKIHDAKDPSLDLSAMLTQVVGSVFELMEEKASIWEAVEGSEPVPVFGFEYTVGLEPVNVNVERMVSKFNAARIDLAPVWAELISVDTYAGIMALEGASSRDFRFPAPLWVRTVLDFAVSFHQRVMHRNHILSALTPLYLARTASFVLETPHADSMESEGIIENLCAEYELAKPYLKHRWREKRS